MKQREVGDTFRDCESCPEMVIVPAGSFIMGSPTDEPDRIRYERLQCQITIFKPFAVGKYAVTRGQFATFIAEAGYNVRSGRHSWHNPVFKQSDAHPVVYVSWDDAKAYVSWLSTHTGEQYRLLSEAEWEYVARAGTTTRYHFGDTIAPSQASYYEVGNVLGTVAVGLYPANNFGLYDMHGNVSEWVEDSWCYSYDDVPIDGSACVSDCDQEDYRVVRGGSWFSYPEDLRSARRYRAVAKSRNVSRGFRVARTLKCRN